MAYFNTLALGVCYYPEHWEEGLWRDDLRRMEENGISVIRIAEFAWNKVENEEGKFDFSFFDRFLDVVETTGIKVIFCTPTATPPAWLTQKYPEVLTVDLDGKKQHHGARRHYNYNSPVYREKTRIIVEQLAKHYGGRKCIIGWQIDNELNCVNSEFYADADHKAFRVFLKEKYKSLEALNEAWGTVFWNQTYTAWEQVCLPRHTMRDTSNPHLRLDSIRFFSESCIGYCRLQYDLLKEYLPEGVFVTTNGLFPHVNYRRMVEEALDFITYDSYPEFGLMEGADHLKDRKWSMNLARARGCGESFGIMEQQSGPGGWYNFRVAPTAKPGQIRLWTYQSIANGADFVSYFRWRTCLFGTEIYWHGILNYDNLDNRRLKEIRGIGEELKRLKGMAGSAYRAKVAILYDYDNEWDGETDVWHGPLRRHSHLGLFEALQKEHIPFDYVTVGPDMDKESLSRYEAVFAPHMTIVDPLAVQAISEYVAGGGKFIAGARSGYKDLNGKCPMAVMPVGMDQLFGIQILDFTAVMKDAPKVCGVMDGERLEMPLFHDILTPVSDSCQVMAVYDSDYYEGEAAVTKNRFGQGEAWYFGAAFSCETAKKLLKAMGLCKEAKRWADVPSCCEIALRDGKEKSWLFVLNYENREVEIQVKKPLKDELSGKEYFGKCKLMPYGVLVFALKEVEN